jgi:hypothetical protein
MNLNQKKQDAEAAILKLNGDYIYLHNNADHQRLECDKIESEKRSLYLKKVRLESVIKELQNTQEYAKIEMIVKQLVCSIIILDTSPRRYMIKKCCVLRI